MITRLISLMMVCVLLGLTACAPSVPVQAQVVKSDKARITAPSASANDLAELAAGNSAFAFDLYQTIRSKDGNLFYSPYSISLALAMTYAGARGNTEAQMADVLHFTLSQARLHPAFNALDLALASRGQGAQGKDDKGFRLSIANSIWGQADYKFLAAFLDALAENYGAGLRLSDFKNASEASRKIINDWVAEETEDRIKDLIPEGAITPLTRLVLANAIYFNASWLRQFEEENTIDAPFYLLDGSQIAVPTMRQTEFFGYADGAGYQAVELLYDGGEMSMVILLPDTGELAAFEGALNSGVLEAILSNIERTNITLHMPKFKYETTLGLTDILQDMGMTDAFSMSADLSGMDGTRDLFITDVLHKAFVAVDEAGTEAAAATAVIVGVKAMPAPPVEVKIDRPFIYLIRDIETGTILFVGRVLDPSA
jgi:serpin B